MVDLIVSDEDMGLGGRHILQLAKRKRSPLPWTRLGVGSPIVLSPDTGKGTVQYRGVVCDRTKGSLRVALGNIPDDLAGHETWRLDLSSDEVAMRRQQAALHSGQSSLSIQPEQALTRRSNQRVRAD